jgi:hypothetical protein
MEEIIVAGMAAEAVRADDAGVAASEVRRLEERVRELERLLGRKTTEVDQAAWRGPASMSSAEPQWASC